MRRGGKLKRAALKRKAPLRSGKPLRRAPAPASGAQDARSASPSRNGLKRKPERLSARERRLAGEWARGARNKPCAVCGREHGTRARRARTWTVVAVHGHHVIEKALLKRRCRELGMNAEATLRVLYDHRNRMSACEDCHGAHHLWSRNGTLRITRAQVARACPKLTQFAAELGVGAAVDRLYPQ